MDYGVTKQGFKRPSFNEIREETINRVREIMGPINTGPESLIGQQINAQVERESLIWEAMEAIYLSQYPESSAGRSLEGAVQLMGLSRRGATRSFVSVVLKGDPGMVVPEESEASTVDGDVFSLIEDVLLDGEGVGEGQMRALRAGAVLALAGTLVNIETPISGWDSVENPDDGEVGREIESDPELRQRWQESLQVWGSGTVPAIRARLLQSVDGVTSVKIIENRSSEVDADGRAPHSFEAIVSGGADQEIAEMLWDVKPAGIETHGINEVVVEDSEGEPHIICFSRASLVYVWVKVEVEEYGLGVPIGAAELIKEKIVEYGLENFGVGDKVLYQALFTPVYANVSGIKSVSVRLAGNYLPEVTPPDEVFIAGNIEVASNEASAWTVDRVEVAII